MENNLTSDQIALIKSAIELLMLSLIVLLALHRWKNAHDLFDKSAQNIRNSITDFYEHNQLLRLKHIHFFKRKEVAVAVALFLFACYLLAWRTDWAFLVQLAMILTIWCIASVIFVKEHARHLLKKKRQNTPTSD